MSVRVHPSRCMSTVISLSLTPWGYLSLRTESRLVRMAIPTPSSCGFCGSTLSYNQVRLRSTHLYPRPFPFKDLSPCEQSLSFPHLSLDMSGLPSYWRCTCVHTHAFHITHDRNQQQAFLGDPSLRRCQ